MTVDARRPSTLPAVLGRDGGIDLAGVSQQSHGWRTNAQTPRPPDFESKFALGDYSGALVAAEFQLGVVPDDAEARRVAQQSRLRLEERYEAFLGPADAIFDRAVPPAEVRWLGVDSEAASVLSTVDGQTTLEETLELCERPRLDALRALAELLRTGAIRRVA